MHYLITETLAGMSNFGEIMVKKVSSRDIFVQLVAVLHKLSRALDLAFSGAQ